MKRHQKGFSAVETVLALALIGVITAVGWYVYNRNQKTDQPKTTSAVTTFEQCKTAGHQVDDTYPERCSANGQTFVNQQQLAAKGSKPYSELPADLQIAILKTYKTDYPDCVKNNKITSYDGKESTLTASYKADAAIAQLSCEGGSAYFFAKEGTTWKKVTTTQMGFDCALLKKYDIPAAWIGNPDADSPEGGQAGCYNGTQSVSYP